jgi:hypothetical protein
MMRAKSKLVLFGALVCLLIWLYIDAAGNAKRKEGIARALARGSIGRLGKDDTEDLQKTINWLAAAAGVRGPVSLNRLNADNQLSVYTTTPDAESLTSCSKGNAVYDGQIDSVFVDVSFLSTYEIRSIFERTDTGPPKDFTEFRFSALPGYYQTYVRFMLLHEFGHRRLHSGRHGLFDGSGWRSLKLNPNEEVEADRFALEAMKTAYRMDLATGGKQVEAVRGDTSFAPKLDPGATTGNQVCADVTAMLGMLTIMSMLTSTPYAPFYEDRDHPNLVSRAKGIARACLDQKDLEPRFRDGLSTSETLYNRIGELTQSPLVELRSARQIEDVVFEKDSVLLSLFGGNSVVRVPLPQIRGAMLKKRPMSQAVDVSHLLNGPPVRSGPRFLWTASESGTFRAEVGALYKAGSHFWEPIRLDPHDYLSTHLVAEVHNPAAPSTLTYLETTDAAGIRSLASVCGSKVVASRTWAAVLADAAQHGAIADTADVTSVTDEGVLLTLLRRDANDQRSLVGLAFLEGRTLAWRYWSGVLRMPKQFTHPDHWNRVIACPNGATAQFLLIKTPERRPAEATWWAWRLSSRGEPVKVGQGPPLGTDVELSNRDPRDVDAPSLSDFACAPPDSVVLNFAQDSVYVLSPRDRDFRLLFPLGDDGTIIRWRLSSYGLAAVFAEDGYKAYLVSTSGTAVSR